MPIVRIGIRNTNNDIPKHNVAKPRAKIQRLVRLSIIYTIQAPLCSMHDQYLVYGISSSLRRPLVDSLCHNWSYYHLLLDLKMAAKSTSSHDDDDDNNDSVYRQIENNMSESFKQ